MDFLYLEQRGRSVREEKEVGVFVFTETLQCREMKMNGYLVLEVFK
jgi:hypothetical protein